jgi:hypothetical protein
MFCRTECIACGMTGAIRLWLLRLGLVSGFAYAGGLY